MKFKEPVRVITRLDENKSAKVINWNDSSDRKWLANHMHWAMHNGASVTVKAESN